MYTQKLLRPQSITLIIATSMLGACANYGNKPMTSNNAPAMPAFNQTVLPVAVQVPSGHKVALETTAKGDITYQCNAKAGMAGQFEWGFIGPKAVMTLRNKTNIGTYFGPPATWVHTDGSMVVGVQIAVAPNAASMGAIPLQLVKVNPKAQAGVYAETSYIQRVNTVGGVAPANPCNAAIFGLRQTVEYSADYIFWKAS